MKNKYIIIILLVIDLIVFYRWFFNFSYLTAGDWSFHFKESIANFIYQPIWRNFQNFGMVDPLPSFYPIEIIYWIFQKLGLDYNLMERFLYFWPAVVIPPIGMFFLANRLFGNRLISFVLSIVYSFNTIYISFLSSWLTFAVVYSLLPLIFLLLLDLLHERSSKKLIIISLIIGLSFAYEPRISYIISILLICYIFYDTFLQADSKGILIKRLIIIIEIFSIVLLLQFFWILPTVMITGQELMNKLPIQPFSSFNTIQDAITLHNYAWNGYNLVPFQRGELNILSYIIPLIAFGYFAINRKMEKLPLFFSLVAIIGIFLVKQGNPPFPTVYEWLFNNLPTFKIFRESSKFWILIIFSYTILIGYFLGEIHGYKNKKLYYIISISIILLFLWNTKPIIYGNLGWTFIGREIPEDYISLKNHFNSDNEYYRTLWVPQRSRFSFYSYLHPSIDLAYTINNEWSNYIDSQSPDTQVSYITIKILNQNYSKNLLDTSSIKYVIIPDKRVDNIYEFYGKRSFYLYDIEKLTWLKKVDLGGISKNITVFENKGYKDHIYSPTYIFFNNNTLDKNDYYNKLFYYTQIRNISDYAIFDEDVKILNISTNEGEINDINKDNLSLKDLDKIFFISKKFYSPNIKIMSASPEMYSIKVEDARGDFPLILSDTYNKEWKAYINNKQISEKYHFIVNEFANGWYINKTGNYTIILEYTPYRFFNYGLIISILTLFFLLLIMIKLW